MDPSVYEKLQLVNFATTSGAMASTLLPILAPKGSELHVLGGRIFLGVLFLGAVVGVMTALNPTDLRPDLLALWVLGLFVAIIGWRAHNAAGEVGAIDWMIAVLMLPMSFAFIGFALAVQNQYSFPLLIISAVGIVLAAGELRRVLDTRNEVKPLDNLVRHISGMIASAACVATAFSINFMVKAGVLDPLTAWVWAPAVAMAGILFAINQFGGKSARRPATGAATVARAPGKKAKTGGGARAKAKAGVKGAGKAGPKAAARS